MTGVRVELPADAPKQTAVFALQAKKGAGGSPGLIDGTALTYGLLNSYGRVFVPGSSTDTLARLQAAGRKLPMGYQHAPYAALEVIGTWTELRDTEAALECAGRISQTQRGTEAATLVEDGAITGISIGFVPLVVQYAAPDERVTFHTPYGERSYQFNDYVQFVLDYELQEASLVSAPADDGARIASIQSLVSKATRALPALQTATWDDAAYSMALLMGGRGAAAFADLPDVEHFALYQGIAGVYRQHGKTAPAYDRRPIYADVVFQHGERDVFADRYLRKTLRTLTAGAGGFEGQLSPETRVEAERAVQLLGDLTQRKSANDRLRELTARVRDVAEQTRTRTGEPNG